jgi:hypothetical protein
MVGCAGGQVNEAPEETAIHSLLQLKDSTAPAGVCPL